MRRDASSHTINPVLIEVEAAARLSSLLKPKPFDRIIDVASRAAGSPAFITLNLLWIAGWLLLNIGLVPGIPPFDPFPFRLLNVILPC
jgi:uncharacterized membrane protein